MNKGLDILKSFNKHIKFIKIAVWTDKLFCLIVLSYDSTTERQNSDINLQIQLRGNQKDVNFQLHHRLSKFEVPVVVNLKHIFELFGLYNTCFLIQKLLELIRSSSDGQFWRKSQNKKGGKYELRSQLCYYNCTQLILELFEVEILLVFTSFGEKIQTFIAL